jgi:hypothetical protein
MLVVHTVYACQLSACQNKISLYIIDGDPSLRTRKVTDYFEHHTVLCIKHYVQVSAASKGMT